MKDVIIRASIAIVLISAIVGYLCESWAIFAYVLGSLIFLGFEVFLIWLFIRMANDVASIREWIQWYFTKDDPAASTTETAEEE